MEENFDPKNEEMLERMRSKLWYLLDRCTLEEEWRHDTSRRIYLMGYNELLDTIRLVDNHQIDHILGGLNYNQRDILRKLAEHCETNNSIKN